MQFFISVAVIISSFSVGVHLQTPPNEHVCDFDSSSAKRTRTGRRSSKSDDDLSTATCGKDYLMIGCECETWPGREDDCDGAWIRENDEETFCDAYNTNGGRGVVAKASCQKIDITCSTAAAGNMPSIRCPSGYQLTDCTMHSSIRHNLWYSPKRHPISKNGQGHLDVVFVVDGSNDITPSGWQDIKTFVDLAVTYPHTSVHDNMRVGYVVYSQDVDFVRNLGPTHYFSSSHQEFLSLVYTGAENNIHTGLNEAAAMLFSTARGARPAANKLVIVITNGWSSWSPLAPSLREASVKALHSEKVHTLAVAIGWHNRAVLSELASDPSKVMNISGMRHYGDYEEDVWYIENSIQRMFPTYNDCCPDFCSTTEGCSSCSVQARCVAVY